jgi:hypothetical protein
MSEVVSHSIEGVARLHVDFMTGDAVLRGLADTAVIEASVLGRGGFVREGDVLRLEGRAERLLVPQVLAVEIEEVNGNLRIQGLAAPVEVGEVHGDLRLDRVSGAVTVDVAKGDIRCDGAAEVTLRHGCHGDLRFSGGGTLSCEDVGGDLRVNDSAGVTAADVHGDIWAERVSGPLTVRRSGGDARLSDVAGVVTIEQQAGDLRGAALVGGLAATEVRGDVILHGPFAGESEYALTVDGDVNLHLSAVDEVRLTVRAAGRIRADIPLIPTADGTPTYTATTGTGASRVTVNAGGDLRIARAGGPRAGASWERKRGQDHDLLPDLSGLGERIRQQVTASLTSAGINLETGEVSIGRGGRWARGERTGRWAPTPPTPPAPPGPPKAPKPPERSEETLTILRLVEEGKITPEEADQLLRALGA